MRRVLLELEILGLLFVASGACVVQGSSARAADAEEPVNFPSLVELLADPAKYEGTLVEVTGYLGGPFPALFLTRDHAQINDLDSAIHVTDETEGFVKKHCTSHYATIEGRFKRQLGGLPGTDPENFEIDDVTQVSVFKDGREVTCWAREKAERR